jgi:type VI secretion system secreted protein Hcp
MSVDFFLQITGIAGESLDAKHKDWIDVMAWSWGEANAGTHETGSGGGAGKVSFSDFNFMTATSKASPKLFLACASGQHIKQAKLVGRKAGKEQQEFLTFTFSDVLVTSYSTSGSEGGDVPADSVSLNAAQVVLSYKPQKPDGSLGNAINAGWDIKTNTKV